MAVAFRPLKTDLRGRRRAETKVALCDVRQLRTPAADAASFGFELVTATAGGASGTKLATHAFRAPDRASLALTLALTLTRWTPYSSISRCRRRRSLGRTTRSHGRARPRATASSARAKTRLGRARYPRPGSAGCPSEYKLSCRGASDAKSTDRALVALRQGQAARKVTGA
eukprot:scaffold8243_cov59-Phaeocystis_antarctica.AAC.2